MNRFNIEQKCLLSHKQYMSCTAYDTQSAFVETVDGMQISKKQEL